jgi:hypothetical protein
MSCPDLGLFTNLKGLQLYRDDDDGPYVTLKEVRDIVHIAIHLMNMQTFKRTTNLNARKMKSCQQTT